MSKIPQYRPAVEIHGRQKLTNPVLLHWAFNYMRCAMCQCSLANGFDDDHITAIALGGTNEPSNRQPLCRPCHKIKTKKDKADIAKAKRRAGETGQVARRKRRKDKGVEIWQQGKKIPTHVNAWGKGKGGNVRVDD